MQSGSLPDATELGHRLAESQVALGHALEARMDEVSQQVVERWAESCPSATGPDRQQLIADIIRTTHAATIAITTYLVEGKTQTPEQKRAEAATGKAPLRDTISLVELTKLYLYWRDATVGVLREEAKRLGIRAPSAERALAVVRAGSDGSIVRMVKEFDRERRRLQEDLKREQARLAHEALHDALTGLPNRKLFFNRLSHALARSERKTFSTAVIFVDIDHFKAVNDRYGHLVGDKVLVAVAARLRDRVRGSDTVARLGGDEFVILCEDLVSPTEETSVIVDRLSEAFARPFDVDGTLLEVTASIGLATATDAQDVDLLLTHADHAMYRAKQAARPRGDGASR